MSIESTTTNADEKDSTANIIKEEIQNIGQKRGAGELSAEMEALIGATDFDITKRSPMDLTDAHRTAKARGIRFVWGRPVGSTGGIALVLNTASNAALKLFKRKIVNGHEFVIPQGNGDRIIMEDCAVPVHVLPVVDITRPSNVQGYLWPLAISNWSGYKNLVDPLRQIDSNCQGLYVRYITGPRGQPGDYSAEIFQLSEEQQQIRQRVKWPTKEDVVASIKRVPVSELAEDDFNIERLLRGIGSK